MILAYKERAGRLQWTVLLPFDSIEMAGSKADEESHASVTRYYDSQRELRLWYGGYRT